ncbi:MAG: response regulator transcription factor [Frankiaceae bacterium]
MRLLLVEDDAAMVRALSRGLRAKGYAVDVASDGDDALVQVAVSDYDAVILDLMLPVRDGFEVCRGIRASGSWVPILMLTARAAVGDRIRGLDAGADDYLAKPFDFGELLARVRALVRRQPAHRPARLEVGDLMVDPATHEVRIGGRAVELTPREFAVLELLARRAGCVTTRSELLEHVWDANYEGSTNIVDVYVGHLRRKLARPDVIRSVRGVGFVLTEQR